MASRNEHTGDAQKTRVPSEEFRNNFDRIFRKVPSEGPDRSGQAPEHNSGRDDH